MSFQRAADLIGQGHEASETAPSQKGTSTARTPFPSRCALADRCDALEGRSPAFALHAATDDATGIVVGAVFRPTECREGYSLVMSRNTGFRSDATATGIRSSDPRTSR